MQPKGGIVPVIFETSFLVLAFEDHLAPTVADARCRTGRNTSSRRSSFRAPRIVFWPDVSDARRSAARPIRYALRGALRPNTPPTGRAFRRDTTRCGLPRVFRRRSGTRFAAVRFRNTPLQGSRLRRAGFAGSEVHPNPPYGNKPYLLELHRCRLRSIERRNRCR